MLELIPMSLLLPGLRANSRKLLPRSQVISIAPRRLNRPLPATSYNPPCESNFQQESRDPVSYRKLKPGNLRGGFGPGRFFGLHTGFAATVTRDAGGNSDFFRLGMAPELVALLALSRAVR